MSTPTARLAALGLELPPVAAPVAAYVPATMVGNLVQTSGQLPLADGSLSVTGLVGDTVDVETATSQARIAGLNALAAAADAAGGLDRIARVVKATVFVASTPECTAQPQVANGASELFQAVFDSAHIRSAVGVASLPLGACVEIEITAETV